MSQTKLNRITVKQKPGTEGFISNGGNTQIFLDDAPLKGVTFLKFEFKPAKPTKIVLEMFAQVDEIDGHYELGQYSLIKSEPADKTQEIVDALLRGGLVFAPRDSGKTAALARILQQDSTAVVFCDTEGQREALLNANNSNLSYDDRVFMNTATSREKFALGRSHIAKVYIDEFEPGMVYPEWCAAVTSRVTVI